MNFIFSKEEKELIVRNFTKLSSNVGKTDKARALRILNIAEKCATNNKLIKLNKKQAEAIIFFCSKVYGELMEITIPAYEKRIEKDPKLIDKYREYIEKSGEKAYLAKSLGRKISNKVFLKKGNK